MSRRSARRRRGWTRPLGVPVALVVDVLECPQMNPRIDLAHEIASMVARTLHPGKAGPLTVSLEGADVRNWWAT